MKHVLTLLSILFLSACATQSKKNVDLTSSPHEETKALSNVDSIPFAPSFVSATPSETEKPRDCSQEEILFLLKTPHNHIHTSERFYSSFTRGNNLAQQFALKFYDKVEGKLTDMDFMAYQIKSLESLNRVMQERQIVVNEYAYSMRDQVVLYKNYRACEAKLEKVLKSKKVDPAKKGCEWEEYRTVVYDPFEIKKNFFEAINLEAEIQTSLFSVNDLIQKHMNGEITEEQLSSGINVIYADMEKRELVRKSKEYKERIDLALERTYSSKKQCLKKK